MVKLLSNNALTSMGLYTVAGTAATAVAMSGSWLQSNILAGGGRDKNLHFYYDKDRGGVVNVLAHRAVGLAAGYALDAAKSAIDDVINKYVTKLKDKGTVSLVADGQARKRKNAWDASRTEMLADNEKFGRMYINGGTDEAIYAIDAYGDRCIDALMLGIPLKNPITYRKQWIGRFGPGTASLPQDNLTTDTLVWYDCTALITVSGDKNLIISKVQGRDWSRKELVSNGDIKFSVSGHLMSNMPEIYPEVDLKKFRQIMQYKGIVRVNNQTFAAYDIDHIVISDFDIRQSEGRKDTLDYSFNAIGVQPAKDSAVKEDVVTIINTELSKASGSSSDKWTDVLNNVKNGVASMAGDIAKQGLANATGMLENIF